MKKFSFPLQPVLELFLHREEEAETRLHRLLGVRAALEETRGRTEEKLWEGRIDLTSRKSIYPDELSLYGNHFRALEEEIERSAIRLRDLDREIEAARADLVEVRKKRRMLEKLRHRRLHDHARKVDRLEQSEADDLHLIRLPRD